MANEGINRLARVLQGRMSDLDEKPPLLDFGEIQGDMSLLTNKFPLPIPQSDYVVCRSVQWGKVDDIFYQTQYPGKDNSGKHMHGDNGEHPHGASGGHAQYTGNGIHSHPDSEGTHNHPEDGREMEHIHDMLIGPKFRWLEPGDRVLVAWAGDDACVIDIIYPATRIGRDADGYDK